MLGILPPTHSCLGVVASVDQGPQLDSSALLRFANDVLALTVLMQMNKDHCLFANNVHELHITQE